MHHQTGSIKIFQGRNEKTVYEEANLKRGKEKRTGHYNLHLYLDEYGIIIVVRRSNKSNLSIECKPIKLPRDNPTSKLLIPWFHKKNWSHREE